VYCAANVAISAALLVGFMGRLLPLETYRKPNTSAAMIVTGIWHSATAFR